MADKSKYQILNDLYNHVDDEFRNYQLKIADFFEIFKEGFASYLGCEVTYIGHADIKDITPEYDYSKLRKPLINSLDYDQDTGFWTLMILVKLSTINPLILSFNLSISNDSNITKISINEIKYKLEIDKKQNIEDAFKSVYEHVFDFYIKKESAILSNNFIHYDKNSRTIGF